MILHSLQTNTSVKWILPGKGIHIEVCQILKYIAFILENIGQFLCRWQKVNPVFKQSSCYRSFNISFIFHWFYKAFSHYRSSTQVAWHCPFCHSVNLRLLLVGIKKIQLLVKVYLLPGKNQWSSNFLITPFSHIPPHKTNDSHVYISVSLKKKKNIFGQQLKTCKRYKEFLHIHLHMKNFFLMLQTTDLFDIDEYILKSKMTLRCLRYFGFLFKVAEPVM